MIERAGRLYRENRFFVVACVCVVLCSILAFSARILYVTPEGDGDYVTYIQTAEFLSGEHVQVSYQRILKPLEPAITAVLSPLVGGFRSAFLIQLLIFYVFSVPAAFLLFGEFFKGERFSTFASVCLFIFGYPMMRWGLALYTETGALFFYILSLYLSMRFIRAPKKRWVWLNLAVVTLGFLYKEYSIITYFIFNGAIFAAPGLAREVRRRYLLIFNFPFIFINCVWQAVVAYLFNYSYITWYLEGGLRGAPVIYHMTYIWRSFFSILIAGWAFVCGSFFVLGRLDKSQKLFLLLVCPASLLCLAWGSVSSRLFYVTAPCLIMLSVLGMDYFIRYRWLKYATLFFVLLINVVCLYKGNPYLF